MELLERDAPLRELDAALKDAAAGEGRVVLVSGEAGIGKTSLVEWFRRECRNSVRVLWGVCDALFTPRPLGPLHDIAAQTQGDLLALLTSESDRTAIFSTFLSELQHTATLVVVEDAHWADEATLDLIKYLGRRIQRTCALLVITYREDEIGPLHPLRTVIGDLATSAATRRLALLPLSIDAARALIADRPFDPVALHRQTDGNPFFITEVLGSGQTGIPATVRDAVLARAARLSLSARTVLEAAAVIGTRVEPWLLADVTGAEAKAAEECLAVGVLVAEGAMFAFRHELARQTILEATFLQHKLVLHRRVLEALKSSPTTRHDLTRLAHHAEGANDHEAVLQYAPAAARQASSAGSHREAVALFELALRCADALSPTEHAQILEAYLAELTFMERLPDEVIVCQKRIELWHSTGNRLREGASFADLSEALVMIGRISESEEASRTSIAILEALSPSVELARAYRAQCFIRMMQRDFAAAVAWGEKAAALAKCFEDVETLTRAYNYMGVAAGITEYERGKAFLEQCMVIAREENLVYALASGLVNLGSLSLEIYQIGNAEYYLAEAITYAMEHDSDYHLFEALAYQARVHLCRGRWVEATETVQKVLQHKTHLVPYVSALIAMGRLGIRRGDSNAWSILDQALALTTYPEIPLFFSMRAARAEAAWLTGDYKRVLDDTNTAYEMAMNKKHPWAAGEIAYWRWRAGDKITPLSWVAKPFALQIAGDWREAAKDWEERGCPYERAMALMDGDEAAQLAALDIFERLGARPAAEIVRQKLQANPTRRLEKVNFGGLTRREHEVAVLITQGKSNREIAELLVLSERTIEGHVSSILNKLGFTTRTQIAAWVVEKRLVKAA